LFHCHLHHRDLHSFPTRRSSDLPAISQRRNHSRGSYFRRTTGDVSVPQNRSLPGDLYESYPLLERLDVWVRQRRWRLREVGRSRDRKSTRLNSSHVSISYAVFCL